MGGGYAGTNGKSEHRNFINQLSELLDAPSAVIGTLGYGHYQNLTPLQNTTPHLVDLHRIFASCMQKAAFSCDGSIFTCFSATASCWS
ncbi:MAG: hypothetical protein U5L01_06545 [Rheinheimera sp.]|nr:hypothetical protein [Rheinheimera sp.]